MKILYEVYHIEVDGDCQDWEVFSGEIFKSKSDAEKWISKQIKGIDYKITEVYLHESEEEN